MKRVLFLALCLTIVNVNGVFSQSKIAFNVRQANKKFDVFNYNAAISKYKKALLKHNADSSYLLQKLADSYRMINDPMNAERWYEELVKRSSDPKNLLFYADVLRQNNKYKEAKYYYEEFLKTSPDDINVKSILKGLSNMAKLTEERGYYDLQLVDFNSIYSDFGPSYFGDSLLYTSNRPSKFGSLKDNWSTNDYYQIFLAKANGNGGFNSSVLRKNIKFHDGPVAFDAINQQLIFTRTNYNHSLVKASDNKTAVLKLYSMNYPSIDTRIKVSSLSFNSNEFSNAHPTISRDGSTLYFVSDRPGGMGGTDIYVSTRSGESWSEPVNLGSPINTIYDEKFPFIADDGTLFFSSSSLGGLGGLDVYYSRFKDGKWSAQVNLGVPINSSKDDFGLISNQAKQNGYFASNRQGGIGDDDIYSFKWEVKKPSTLIVRVVDAITNNPIPNATIQVACLGNKLVYTNDLGEATITTEIGETLCSLKASAVGYTSAMASLSKENLTTTLVIPLSKAQTRLLVLVKEEGTNEPIRDVNVMFKDLTNDQIITMRTNEKGLIDLRYDNTKGVKIASHDFIKEIVGSIDPSEMPNEKGYYLREFTIPLRDRKVNVPITSDCFLNKTPVEVINNTTKETFLANVDENGMLTIDLLPYSSYTLNFAGKSEVLNTKGLTPGQIIQLECKYKVGQTWLLKNIYYDLDKSYIRPDAAIELDKLVSILKQNPTLEIELSSHTDCRSSASYNQALSARRAKSAVDYIISKGVKSSRMISRGYGESMLINNCPCEPGNDSSCSEEEHQQNRRTEVKVTKY